MTMPAHGSLNFLQRLPPALADRFFYAAAQKRKPGTALPDNCIPWWIDSRGLAADGPQTLSWGGMRWDSSDDWHNLRPSADGRSGPSGLGHGFCDRLILAQNCHHDGQTIHLGPSYTLALRRYEFAEPAIGAHLNSLGFSSAEISSGELSAAHADLDDGGTYPAWHFMATTYATDIVRQFGGVKFSRPFMWPRANHALVGVAPEACPSLYSMPDFAISIPRRAALYPSYEAEDAAAGGPLAERVGGFYALRVIEEECLHGREGDFPGDLATVLLRAFSGSEPEWYGPRYGTKAEFLRDLPPFTAFDLRLHKRTKLFKYKVVDGRRRGAGEFQAIFNATAYRVVGSPPAGIAL